MKINRLVFVLLILSHTVLAAEEITFSADFMRHEAAEGRKYTVLSGNAKVITGEKTIIADEIKLLGSDFSILECRGNVIVNDAEEDLRISSEHLYYDRNSQLIKIVGNSVLEDLKNEMVIKSGYLEYLQDEEKLKLQIGVRILKENLTCRCEFADYDKGNEILVMTGLPVVYKENDVFRASRITINLDNDEILMDGKVEGSLTIEDEENPENKKDERSSDSGSEG